ncbi:MAG: T9SS type B sorting domain-containing protein [Luteibaculaceae bacterium]
MKQILFIVFSCILTAQGFAAHLAGGYIRYECLGNNQYEIELVIFRDCNHGTPFDGNTRVQIFDANGTSFTTLNIPVATADISELTLNTGSVCLEIPPTICFEKGVFTATVTLPPSIGGYYAVYQRCCRGGNVLNLLNSGDTGSSYVTHIPGPDLVGLGNCNSSPDITSLPEIAYCVGFPASFTIQAADSDADSLSFKMCNLLNGGSIMSPYPNPFTPPPHDIVPFNNAGGFFFNNPFGVPDFSINESTGEMTFTSNQIGLFAAQVCIEEWRNNVRIGTTNIEIQFSGVNCALASAGIEELNSEQACNGLIVDFTNSSFTPGEIPPTFLWSFLNNGDTLGISTLSNPSFEFPSFGQFEVSLIVLPGEFCADTTSIFIDVFPLLAPEIEMPPTACINENIDLFAAGSFTGGAEFLWEILGSSQEIATTRDVENISYLNAGNFQVNLTIFENGCERSASEFITVYNRPIADFTADITQGCQPLEVNFTNTSNVFGADYFLDWHVNGLVVDDGDSLNFTFNEAGFYDIKAIVYTTNNCVTSDTLAINNFITVWPNPTAALEILPSEIVFIDNPFFSFRGLETDVDCFFTLGDLTFTDCDNAILLDQTGFIPFSYTATTEFGCTTSVFKNLLVNGTLVFIPNAFTPNNDGVNDIFKPVVRGADIYHLEIFDRWGNKVFETRDTNRGWDGKNAKGSEVFTYKILTADHLGNEELRYGTLTVLK